MEGRALRSPSAWWSQAAPRSFAPRHAVASEICTQASLGRRLGLGPFASFSLGEFTHVRREAGKRVLSDQNIGIQELHLWAVIGLRLSFGA